MGKPTVVLHSEDSVTMGVEEERLNEEEDAARIAREEEEVQSAARAPGWQQPQMRWCSGTPSV